MSKSRYAILKHSEAIMTYMRMENR